MKGSFLFLAFTWLEEYWKVPTYLSQIEEKFQVGPVQASIL